MFENVIIPGGRLELREIPLDDTKKANTYISQIYDIEENDRKLSIAMPVKEGRIIPLSVGMRFDAYFYTHKGLFQCEVVVIGRYKQNNLYTLEVEIKTPLRKIQRRQYFRYPITLTIRYALLDEAAITFVETIKSLPDDYMKDALIESTTLDISGGGVRFSGEKLLKNDKIYLEIDYDFNDSIQTFKAIASVVDSEAVSGRDDIYHNRAGYEVVNSKEREQLIKFIFAKERASRRYERKG